MIITQILKKIERNYRGILKIEMKLTGSIENTILLLKKNKEY